MAEPIKKSKWKRRLLIGFGIVCVLLVIALWAAPGFLAKSSFKDRFLKDVSADLNGTVEVGAVSLAWFDQVELHDVKVKDLEGRTAFVAEKVSTSKTLLELAKNRLDLGTFTLHKPVVTAYFDPKETNWETMLAKYLKPTDPNVLERTPMKFEVKEGTVILIDKASGETGRIENLNASVEIPKLKADAIQFRATATSGGTISLEGETGSSGTATLKAKGFDLAAIRPAVRYLEPSTLLGGSLNAEGKFGWTLRSQGLPDVSAEGAFAVNDLSLATPTFGKGSLKLKSVELPLKGEMKNGAVKIEKLNLTTDAGTASFAGRYDLNAPLHKNLDQTGLRLDADLDLAKLAAISPELLRLKEGTEVKQGRIVAHLESDAGKTGVQWSGSLNATKLEAVRDNRPISWEQPLVVTFNGRLRPDGLPAFDKLVVQSDFIGAQARGEPENFEAIANVDLSKLGEHLDDLLDLNGLKLKGFAKEVTVKVRPRAAGGYTVTANGSVQNLEVADRVGVLLKEADLQLDAQAEGARIPEGTGYRMEAGRLEIHSGRDRLDLVLFEPIADAQALSTGKVRVNLTGDLDRWRRRLGPQLGFPKGWDIGGDAKQVSAVVELGEVVTARNVQIAITNARFRGLGLNLDEPELRLDTADPAANPKLAPDQIGTLTYNRTTGGLAVKLATLKSETVSGAIERFEMKPNGQGETTATGKANIVARLERLQSFLQLQSAKDFSDQFRGIATGSVELNAPTLDKPGFALSLKIDNFAYGNPKTPAWSEPWVTVGGTGWYHVSKDALHVDGLGLGRDGLSAQVKGIVDKPLSALNLDLGGTMTYDLARIEPTLKQYLGATASIAGKETKPFRVQGPLSSPSLEWPGTSKTDLSKLNGDAAVKWTGLKAYGFDVGQAEVQADLKKGILTTASPIEATFGGGKVRLEPTVNLTPGAYDLTAKKGRVIEKAKLTPAACAEAIGYALPAIANVAQADGTISFDLGENRIPLAEPTKGTFAGNLTIHEATVSPGPIIAQLIDALNIKQPKMQLSQGNVVPIAMKDGRVTHSNFLLNVGGTTVTSRGSVGVDKSVDLIFSVPVGAGLAEKLLPGRAALQKALAKQNLEIAITGTLNKPNLDGPAMQKQMQALMKKTAQDAIGETGKELLDDVFKKGLDDLFKKK